MTKDEFISTMASKAELTKAATGRAMDAFILTLIDVLQKNDSFNLPGIGTFGSNSR